MKHKKQKKIFQAIIFVVFWNFLMFYVPIFLFTPSAVTRHYYLQTWYIQAASRVAERFKT